MPIDLLQRTSADFSCTPLDCHSYGNWLPQWKRHVASTPNHSILPLSAQDIATPLQVQNWQYFLHAYPNQQLMEYFTTGLLTGFRIGCSSGTQLRSAKRSKSSALAHRSVVNNYLQVELDHNRVAGPFPRSQCLGVHISHFGFIPKSHQPNKWYLIVDLSHPSNHSVNDYIPKPLCSLKYITVDDAIHTILQYGLHSLQAKADIKSAFRFIQQTGTYWACYGASNYA